MAADPIILAVTGASGAIYGLRAIELLRESGRPVELVVSAAGRRVAREELGFDYGAESLRQRFGEEPSCPIRLHPESDVGATVASGSHPCGGMLVAPCSMGTAARIAAGLSSNLVERAADVQLKERRPLVLLVRETPLSTLHLENLTRLSRVGATVMPAAPGFYQRPDSVAELVDFVLDRALRSLGVRERTEVRWSGRSPDRPIPSDGAPRS